uniref:Uncharacterized protein n=1 Tax=Pseudictyota dubia TaxID=2749911 RepID=A0A7R9WEL0_9STRA|mmetsp:Transcript_45167/g.83581  ORF Transcript_45167/g.83581 Transcript_45167/m.83581 type:complete len:369 (+) Transcript_45167:149-1255(+)
MSEVRRQGGVEQSGVKTRQCKLNVLQSSCATVPTSCRESFPGIVVAAEKQAPPSRNSPPEPRAASKGECCFFNAWAGFPCWQHWYELSTKQTCWAVSQFARRYLSLLKAVVSRSFGLGIASSQKHYPFTIVLPSMIESDARNTSHSIWPLLVRRLALCSVPLVWCYQNISLCPGHAIAPYLSVKGGVVAAASEIYSLRGPRTFALKEFWNCRRPPPPSQCWVGYCPRLKCVLAPSGQGRYAHGQCNIHIGRISGDARRPFGSESDNKDLSVRKKRGAQQMSDSVVAARSHPRTFHSVSVALQVSTRSLIIRIALGRPIKCPKTRRRLMRGTVGSAEFYLKKRVFVDNIANGYCAARRSLPPGGRPTLA